MIHEIAVADSYAIAFEFVRDPASHGLVNDLATFQQNPKYDTLKPSQYTDDTQRTLATGWTIASGDFYDPLVYLANMVREFHEWPRDGYSRNFQKLMDDAIQQDHEKTGSFHVAARKIFHSITHRKESNGSIMGCLPCGFLPNPVDLRSAATAQAIATHSVTTAPYAQRMALAAHYFIHDVAPHDDMDEFLRFVLDEAEGGEVFVPGDPVGPVEMSALDTSTQVLRLVMKHNRLSDLLRHAVDLRGDTDSVAALAVGIASCSGAYEHDLPKVLWDGVEFGNAKAHKDMKDLDETLWMVAQGE